jgi:hypothetical protein
MFACFHHIGPTGGMPHTLIVGYGNLDRSDDGIAHQATNMLRRRLGQEALSEGDTGLEDLRVRTDSLFLPQLVPHLIDTLVDYDKSSSWMRMSARTCQICITHVCFPHTFRLHSLTT